MVGRDSSRRDPAGGVHASPGALCAQTGQDLDVRPSRISELIHGRRPITPDTALRLGLFFQQDPRFWLQLQMEYDLRLLKRERQADLQQRISVFSAEAVTSA